MPTLVTRYVDTRSPVGGNGTTPSTGSGDPNRAYPNLSASLAAESSSRGDLVALDQILKIECAGTVDTSCTDLIIPAFNTDYNRYVSITVNSASRHVGIWDTGSKYTVASSGPATTLFYVDNIKVISFDGLQMENRSTNGTFYIIRNVNTADIERQLTVTNCHLRALGVGPFNGQAISFGYIIRKNVVAINNIIHGPFDVGILCDYQLSGSRPTVIYNNTIYGAKSFGISTNFANAVVTHSLYNNIVIMSSSNGQSYETSSTNFVRTGNNISSDAFSPQAALQNINVQFVNTASGDFRLTDRSSPAVNTGANLSNDILYPFTTDVAGNVRATGAGGRQWDIGALEYQRPTTVIQSGSAVRGNVIVSPTGIRGLAISSNTW